MIVLPKIATDRIIKKFSLKHFWFESIQNVSNYISKQEFRNQKKISEKTHSLDQSVEKWQSRQIFGRFFWLDLD